MPKTMTAILTCVALGLPPAAAAGGLKLPPEAAYLVGGTNRAPGATPPEGVILDGHDWWPCLRGEAESPRSEMFWKRKSRVAARLENWKWVDMDGKAGGLYNLAEDIGEKNDLSGKHPDVLQLIKDRYANWMKTMDEAEPRGPFRDF